MMSNTSRAEAFFQGADQNQLFYQIWRPSSSKGSLIITHGQAEHSDCYQRVVDALQSLSLTVYAWDLRGHGRSEGHRGYVKNFEDYVRDYGTFFTHLRREHHIESTPIFLLGHSMGGLIQMQALLANPQWKVHAQALSSPMMGVAVEVPLYKDIGALILNRLLPQVTMGNEISYSDLTRDPEVIEEFNKDVLRHDKISSGVYLGSIAAMDQVRHHASQLRVPTLLQIPEEDPVVGSENNRILFAKLGASDKILKVYSGRKHEIFNDLGREEVFADLSDFLARHLK